MAKVVLPDGKNVEISSVLLNKEQNINVSKTYVTTVKKAVTKVSEDFYKVAEAKKDEPTSQIFEAMKEDVFTSTDKNLESVKTEKQIQTVVPELPALDPVSVIPSAAELPKVEPVTTTPLVTQPSKEDLNQGAETILNPNVEKKADNVVSELPKIDPIMPMPVVAETPKEEVKSESGIIPNSNEGENVDAVVQEMPKVQPILPVDPIQNIEPVVSPAPVVSSESITKVDNSEPKLFFDGSKETNLNMALGEVSEEKTMTTESEGVQALRQFGSDEPVLPPQEPVLSAQEDVKTLTRSKGFANNKFFVIIAIAFFAAACVFLGYEAFQYFQIAG